MGSGLTGEARAPERPDEMMAVFIKMAHAGVGVLRAHLAFSRVSI
jgi:hypothetical protein